MFYILNRYISLNLLIIWVSEFILILLASLFMISVQFGFDGSLIAVHEPSLIKASVLAVIYFAIFYFFDLYTPELYHPDRQMILKLIQAILTASVVLISIYFLYPSLGVGREKIIGNAMVLPVLLIAWRAIFTEVLSVQFPEKRVLIVGYGDLARKIGSEIIKWSDHGLKLVGCVDNVPTPARQSIEKKGENSGQGTLTRRKSDVEVVGGYGDIERIINSEKIYKIIVAPPDRRDQLPMSALLKCKLQGVRIVEGETFHERMTGKIPLDQLKPSWVIFSDGFKSLRSKKILKRLLDICLSVIGLILASPLLLITAFLIKVSSKGPVLYKQTRVGENEKEYEIYKFRSMRHNAETGTGSVWAGEKDDRVTMVGKNLRKWRIDEIPQLINVLKGEMSFVGPRPERPHFVAELKQKIPYYEMRTVVKPGITGWAQIKYQYGATVEDALEKLQYDIYYIKNMSPLQDAMIILSTIKVVLSRKGAR